MDEKLLINCGYPLLTEMNPICDKKCETCVYSLDEICRRYKEIVGDEEE